MTQKKAVKFPETLQECMRYFADDDRALDFMKSIRWPDGVVKCPRCGSEDVAFMSARRLWRCRADNKQFSVKVGTIMEDSPISLDKWLCAFWLIVNAKNGISSYELMRSLGLTQKTSWYLLHRIRFAMQSGSFDKLKGQVEADETFIGAKARNIHKNKRRANMYGTMIGKTAVLGLLERNTPETTSRVRLKVVESVRRHDLDPEIRKHVEKGSEVHTDKLRSYENLADEYVHQVIDHAECYARGHVHTNGLENFWSLLKRGIRGTYVNVEPFHLFRYLDEQAFRFNERKDNDAGRFIKAVAGYVGKGLRYSKLIGQEDGDSLPPETTGTWQTA
jgi:transposase-like protein